MIMRKLRKEVLRPFFTRIANNMLCFLYKMPDMFTSNTGHVCIECRACLHRKPGMFTSKAEYVYIKGQVCLHRKPSMFTSEAKYVYIEFRVYLYKW